MLQPEVDILYPPQLELPSVYRFAVIEYPPTGKSADSAGEVEANDGFRYHVKLDKNSREERASEWICSKLAEAAHITCPPFEPIRMKSGDIAFGSRRVMGVAPALDTTAYLTSSTYESEDPEPSRSLSRIYAFDMFVMNIDRHYENYLMGNDGYAKRIFAFDFGRALFWDWPLRRFPNETENTRLYGKPLWQLHGFDLVAAENTLAQLSLIDTGAINGFLSSMPDEWITEASADKFLQWWASEDRFSRIEALREGITNGKLL